MVIRIISENSEEQLKAAAKRRARDLAENELKMALRRLTANLLRIVRGAGRPADLVEQMELCAKLFREYPVDTSPSLNEAMVRSFLDPATAWLEYRPWIRESHATIDSDGGAVREARLRMIDAALQVAASSLLDQATQVSKARHELIMAARAQEEPIHARNRIWKAPKRPRKSRRKTEKHRVS